MSQFYTAKAFNTKEREQTVERLRELYANIEDIEDGDDWASNFIYSNLIRLEENEYAAFSEKQITKINELWEKYV